MNAFLVSAILQEENGESLQTLLVQVFTYKFWVTTKKNANGSSRERNKQIEKT